MLERKVVYAVEIDIDQCTRTWGSSPCLAAFGIGTVRKCYNSFETCAYTAAYNKGVNTLKFIQPTYAVKGGNYMPHLMAVGGYEQEVNIAGFSKKIGSLGVRANVTLKFRDFPDRDTLTDKYWAGRMDGTAQTNEPGYDPLQRGSFWTKFRARNPNYAGRPLRVIQGHIDEATGAMVYDVVRSYVIDTLEGPSRDGTVTIVAKDIMALVDDVKAVAPVASRGRLLADIDAATTTATLSPAGIGSEYPVGGYATIGSEIVGFSRVGDVLTFWGRGQLGTSPASHNANDTVQLAYHVNMTRADTVIYNLLTQYGNIPTSYINFSEWQAEFNKWGNKFLLTATICKPTGVSKLIGEINQLGITVWWDEVAQKIRIRLNHPPDEQPVTWSDSKNIMSIETKDNDDERATRIEMWTIQIDPTKDLNEDNFLRGYMRVAVDAESPFLYDGSRTQKILCRWLNHGADDIVRIVSGRLLNRYKRAPKTYHLKIDAKDNPDLVDVIRLNSHVATDVTGLPREQLTQVFYRADDKLGHTVKVSLEAFQFDQRYGVITNNDRPVYGSSTNEERRKGSYFLGSGPTFSDGSGPYVFI